MPKVFNERPENFFFDSFAASLSIYGIHFSLRLRIGPASVIINFNIKWALNDILITNHPIYIPRLMILQENEERTMKSVGVVYLISRHPLL